ncbi:hypothetical protein, partial [Streptomyces olivaceus]|uniref:hypothetical protein n=1 Tax=Streptomyces olivaceus TaxID=47716 RepID=UPI0040560F16
MDSAGLGGVSGTPVFFVKGRRHHGAHDVAAPTRAVEQARRRAPAGPPPPPPPPTTGEEPDPQPAGSGPRQDDGAQVST